VEARGVQRLRDSSKNLPGVRRYRAGPSRCKQSANNSQSLFHGRWFLPLAADYPTNESRKASSVFLRHTISFSA
jgi:hypothetical protein